MPRALIGLIETMRASGGRLPWLSRHLARLKASIAALGVRAPSDDFVALVRFAVGSGERGDRVVRLQLTDGQVEIATREVNTERDVAIVVSTEVHAPYPHKTTRRDLFGRALANARRAGAHDALLLTPEGYVAEGTAWNLFWWDKDDLCTPAADLGILCGIGRQRVLELTPVQEVRAPLARVAGRSLFLVNAVRGIVPIAALEGVAVKRDPRTAELAAAFWPD